jgi:hypothetical protein
MAPESKDRGKEKVLPNISEVCPPSPSSPRRSSVLVAPEEILARALNGNPTCSSSGSSL